MNLVQCKCNKCGYECLSIKGMQHRRCSGKPNHATDKATIRDKNDKLPLSERGIWE